MNSHRRLMICLLLLFSLVVVGCQEYQAATKLVPDSTGLVQTSSTTQADQTASNESSLQPSTRLHTEPIQFGPFDFLVKSGRKGPGPNDWGNSFDNVVLADDGLHLKIVKKEDKFLCSEVQSKQLAEFGTYQFTVSGSALRLRDKNVVIGVFVYRDDLSEADIELLNADAGGNLLFTVQPASERTSHRASTGDAEEVTLVFHWEPGIADFKCWKGNDTQSEPIAKWRYQGPEVSRPIDTHFHANIWLMGGRAPESEDEIEVVIRNFQFTPLGSTNTGTSSLPSAKPTIDVWAEGDGRGSSDVHGYVNGILPGDAQHFLVRTYARTDIWYDQPFVGSKHRIDKKSLTFSTWTRPWYNGLRADLIDTRTGAIVSSKTHSPRAPQPNIGNGYACWLTATQTRTATDSQR